MKTKWLQVLLIAGGIMMLGSCTGHNLSHYTDKKPTMDLQDYFTGPIDAWGVVQNRKGEVVRQFDIRLVGSWEGDTGTLKEDFYYYDGEEQQRTWTIRKTGKNRYEGSAGDIIGVATGETTGNAMRWSYVMDLPVGDTTYKITFDDWMFLMNDGVLINRSYLKKFGIKVAELTIFMKKVKE